eukprot:631939_1
MFAFFLLSWLHFVLGSQTTKQTILNGTITSQNGAKYNADVKSQEPYDLKLSLDSSWGFHAQMNSSITFTMDASTAVFGDDDNEYMWIVFSVADLQYFSLYLSRNQIKIYPSVSRSTQQHQQHVSDWISDTNSIKKISRKISTDDQWIMLDPINNNTHPSLWPLTFQITNFPLQKESLLELYHHESMSVAKYEFDASFITNQKMDVYILCNMASEPLIVSSFDIIYTQYNQSKVSFMEPIDDIMNRTAFYTTNLLQIPSSKKPFYDVSPEAMTHFAIISGAILLVMIQITYILVHKVTICCNNDANIRKKLELPQLNRIHRTEFETLKDRQRTRQRTISIDRQRTRVRQRTVSMDRFNDMNKYGSYTIVFLPNGIALIDNMEIE